MRWLLNIEIDSTQRKYQNCISKVLKRRPSVNYKDNHYPKYVSVPLCQKLQPQPKQIDQALRAHAAMQSRILDLRSQVEDMAEKLLEAREANRKLKGRFS